MSRIFYQYWQYDDDGDGGDKDDGDGLLAFSKVVSHCSGVSSLFSYIHILSKRIRIRFYTFKGVLNNTLLRCSFLFLFS